MLQVDADAALPAVEDVEPVVNLARRRQEAHAVASRWFNLHDVGAVVGHLHRGGRAILEGRQVDDPEPGERAGARHLSALVDEGGARSSETSAPAPSLSLALSRAARPPRTLSPVSPTEIHQIREAGPADGRNSTREPSVRRATLALDSQQLEVLVLRA